MQFSEQINPANSTEGYGKLVYYLPGVSGLRMLRKGDIVEEKSTNHPHDIGQLDKVTPNKQWVFAEVVRIHEPSGRQKGDARVSTASFDHLFFSWLLVLL
jgi:hypothetical protein